MVGVRINEIGYTLGISKKVQITEKTAKFAYATGNCKITNTQKACIEKKIEEKSEKFLVVLD